MSEKVADPWERVRRMLADLFGTRIVDVEEADVRQFLDGMTKHGLVVITDRAVVR
jgi:hypothetical protein